MQMGMDVQVGGTEVFAQLMLAVEAAQDTAFPEIAADFHKMEAARWAANGPGWQSLSPATVAMKEAAGMPDPGRILYGHGDLLDSLTGTGAHAVMDISLDELFVGTDLDYAQYHQSGPRNIMVYGKTPAVLPERVLVEVTQEDADRWCAMVQAAVFGVTGA